MNVLGNRRRVILVLEPLAHTKAAAETPTHLHAGIADLIRGVSVRVGDGRPEVEPSAGRVGERLRAVGGPAVHVLIR